jgi:hypothetical protein
MNETMVPTFEGYNARILSVESETKKMANMTDRMNEVTSISSSLSAI